MFASRRCKRRRRSGSNFALHSSKTIVRLKPQVVRRPPSAPWFGTTTSATTTTIINHNKNNNNNGKDHDNSSGSNNSNNNTYHTHTHTHAHTHTRARMLASTHARTTARRRRRRVKLLYINIPPNAAKLLLHPQSATGCQLLQPPSAASCFFFTPKTPQAASFFNPKAPQAASSTSCLPSPLADMLIFPLRSAALLAHHHAFRFGARGCWRARGRDSEGADGARVEPSVDDGLEEEVRIRLSQLKSRQKSPAKLVAGTWHDTNNIS